MKDAHTHTHENSKLQQSTCVCVSRYVYVYNFQNHFDVFMSTSVRADKHRHLYVYVRIHRLCNCLYMTWSQLIVKGQGSHWQHHNLAKQHISLYYKAAGRCFVRFFLIQVHVFTGAISFYGHLTRYVKLQAAHAPGMPGTFPPPPISKENR